MPYRSYEPDAPDPGTVLTDDRCPSCGAGEGEACDPGCTCHGCLTRRAQASQRRVTAKYQAHARRRTA